MRILDLGAHDGYVSAWLKQRSEGDVEVDGVELNPEGVIRANRRGINCKRGAAEDAPALFEPGSYDAVLLFELLEHVVDVDRLLAAAERMVKPEGRLYLSTPDGTFGEGNNPHHLRAYRSIDLVDLLRRRGRLHDVAVGGDGVTVASYSPAPRRGDIAIYTGPSWMPWSPNDMETRGLGGSETAAVRLAEHLSCLGYVVTVYGEVEQCAFRDVIFRHYSVFDPMDKRLATIASRLPEVFDRPLASRVRLLWLHDTDCGERLTGTRAQAIDHVLVLSKWHQRHVGGMYPFVRQAKKLKRIRNGIEHAYFRGEPLPRAKRVLYTSSPDRGLDVLLELWPQVRKRVPDAQLAFLYAPVYDAAADQLEQLGEFRERIRSLADQPGVEDLGALSQPALACLMRESLVWAHPSYCTPAAGAFHETSCIGAMEAQAAGCLTVASGWGALVETAASGRLIGGKPLSKRWRSAFVDELVDGLTNEETQRWAQTAGPKAARKFGWAEVAQAVEGLVEAGRTPQRAR